MLVAGFIGLLHAVQDAVQSQMAAHIETIETDAMVPEIPSDDTALYRISGWALKSAIDSRKEKLKKGACKATQVQQELDLLLALQCSKTAKSSLPPGVQYLDRGGLTFMHSSLLPWMHAAEQSMKVYLSHDGYKKYGQHIFQVRVPHVN